MTVNLQALAIKSEVKVAMRYKNFKAVAMRCKNKGKPKDVTKDCVILQNILECVLTVQFRFSCFDVEKMLCGFGNAL